MENIFGNKRIQIIRHAGDLNHITLEDGKEVSRLPAIFVNQEIGLTNSAPYDNHFLFKHVFGDRGWTLWCTCGSPAGVVGYEAYKKDASRQGQLLVCLSHAQSGKHLDGSN